MEQRKESDNKNEKRNASRGFDQLNGSAINSITLSPLLLVKKQSINLEDLIKKQYAQDDKFIQDLNDIQWKLRYGTEETLEVRKYLGHK